MMCNSVSHQEEKEFIRQLREAKADWDVAYAAWMADCGKPTLPADHALRRQRLDEAEAVIERLTESLMTGDGAQVVVPGEATRMCLGTYCTTSLVECQVPLRRGTSCTDRPR